MEKSNFLLSLFSPSLGTERGCCKINNKAYHFLIAYYFPGLVLKLTFNHVSYTPCLHGECSSGTISTILQMNRGTEINWLAFGLTAKASRSSQPELADSRVAVPVTMIQCVLEWSYEHSTYFSFLYKLPDVTSLS